MGEARRGGRAKRGARALLLGLVLVASAARAAPAQEAARATVRLDGRALFRVAPVDTLPARERANEIERRLEQLLDLPAAGPAVVERTAAGETLVSMNGVPVLTITAADTVANASGAEALGLAWAQIIERAVGAGRAQRTSGLARLGAQVRSSVARAFGNVGESAIVVIPRIAAALLVLLFFWLIARAVRGLARVVLLRVVRDVTLAALMRQSAFYAVWGVGALVAIGALGLEPGAVATGLGLTGLALGFALKDVLSNFVSGMLILLLRPFRLGDQIVVGETEGTVERIELRATQIRTYDGRSALLPNADVFTSRLINNTATPVRRGSVTVCLGFDADLRTAMEVGRRAARASEGVLPEPEPTVRIRDFAAEGVVLDVRFWTDSRRSDYLDTASAVRLRLLDELASAGLSIPDPQVRFLVRSRAHPAGGRQAGARRDQSG